MKTLIVIDMQNDFITGALGSAEAVAILPAVKQKISEYEEAGNEIIYTRDTHYENYMNTQEGRNLPVPHCIEGTPGWEIADGLYIKDCVVIDKPSFGWTRWWTFDNTPGFRQNTDDEIEIIGVCTDICVVSNALLLKAMMPELKISVDATCCAGVTPESHEAALKTMEMCQINVKRG